MIAEAILALEQSGFGQAARATFWLYPLANLVHILGAAMLVGGIAVFDIQVLRGAPDASRIARAAIPIAACGLALQLVSGLPMFAAEATAFAGNLAFQVKLGLIVLGLANILYVHRRFGAALRGEASLDAAKPFAALSLASWTFAMLAGRAIAYI